MSRANIYMLSRCECAWAQGLVWWWLWSDCEQTGPITRHPWLLWRGRGKSAYRSESPRSTHEAGASAARTRVTVAGSVAVSRITSAEVRYCPYCGLSGSCVCACARAWQEMKSACTNMPPASNGARVVMESEPQQATGRHVSNRSSMHVNVLCNHKSAHLVNGCRSWAVTSGGRAQSGKLRGRYHVGRTETASSNALS